MRIIRKLHHLTHPVLGRILMLHRVVTLRDEEKNRELEITPDFLEQTIGDYREKGFRFVSIDEACDIIEKGKRMKPFVCLTFDDGYSDNFTLALPLLKRLEVPFAIYVTTGFVDNRLPMWWYPDERLGLGLDELKALDAEPLCSLCCHTVSHPHLDKLSAEEQYREIAESKNTLEQWLGHAVHHFSYPHGAYDDDTLKQVNVCAYRSALQAWGGNVRRGDSLLLLPRIELRQP